MPVNKSPPWSGKDGKQLKFLFGLCTLPGSKGIFNAICVVSTFKMNWDQHFCLWSLTNPKEE